MLRNGERERSLGGGPRGPGPLLLLRFLLDIFLVGESDKRAKSSKAMLMLYDGEDESFMNAAVDRQ